MIRIKKGSFSWFLIVVLYLILTLIIVFPVFKNKVMLPLDLLVNENSPWQVDFAFPVKNPFLLDAVTQIFPWKNLVAESLQNRVFRLWNPYSATGMPFFGNMKTAMLYPINWFFLLGKIQGWHLIIFSQIFLSFITSYLLAKEFKLSNLTSLFVSIAFSLNSLMIGFLEFGHEGHIIMFFPLFFLLTKKTLESKKRLYPLLLSTSIALAVLAGQFQLFLYGFLANLAFAIYWSLNNKIRLKKVLLTIFSMILGLGLAAIQILPTLEMLRNSPRSSLNIKAIFSNDLLNPIQLIRFIVPDYFGHPATRNMWGFFGYIEQTAYFGTISLFFAIYSIIFIKKNKVINFFKAAFIISLLSAIKPFAFWIYFLKIPVLSSNPGQRVLVLIPLFGAILAGFGIKYFFKQKSKKQALFLWTWISLYLAILIITYVLKKYLPEEKSLNFSVAFRNLIFPTAIMFLFFTINLIYRFIKKKKNIFEKKYLVIIFILILFFDFWRFSNKFIPFSNKEHFYPQAPVIEFLQNNTQNEERYYGLLAPELFTIFNLYSLETYNPLYPKRYAEFIAFFSQGNTDILDRNRVLINPNSENTKRLFDLTNTVYFINRKDYLDSDWSFPIKKYQKSFTKVWDDEHFIVYKNLDSLPKYELFYDFEIIKEKDDILKKLSDKNFNFKKKLILEENPEFEPLNASGSTILKYLSSDKLVFEIDTKNKALFFLADNYYPGWAAKIDNKPTKILRTNYTFRSVVVPTGKHLVEFVYQPNSLKIGALISVFSLTCCFVCYKKSGFFS